MTAITIGQLAPLLRLAEGITRAPDNFRGLGELIQGLNNVLNQVEKADDDD
jgi:hypothetical protein